VPLLIIKDKNRCDRHLSRTDVQGIFQNANLSTLCAFSFIFAPLRETAVHAKTQRKTKARKAGTVFRLSVTSFSPAAF
jgi:hypothetical protein